MAEDNFESWRENNFVPWLEDQMEIPKIPNTFRSLGAPWRVSDQVNQSEIINKVLEHSFEIQASRIDASSDLYANAVSLLQHEGKHLCTMDRQCIEISGLLQYYFSWLDIDAKVFCGTMIRPGHWCKDASKFHTFLEIEDEIIDNTYSYAEVSITMYNIVLSPPMSMNCQAPLKKTFENWSP